MSALLARCAAVWLTVTTATGVVGAWAAPDLPVLAHPGTAVPFVDVLAAAAALALVGCAAWCWGVCTVVVASAVRAGSRHPVLARTGVPPWAQRLVLAACGAALVSTTTLSAASATPGPVVVVGQLAGGEPARGTSGEPGVGAVAGLSLPDRTTGARRPVRTLTVQPGDSLWAIAERLLAPGASTAEVADLVSRLHDLNRAAIGADPDLIHPGHQLRTPLGARPAR